MMVKVFVTLKKKRFKKICKKSQQRPLKKVKTSTHSFSHRLPMMVRVLATLNLTLGTLSAASPSTVGSRDLLVRVGPHAAPTTWGRDCFQWRIRLWIITQEIIRVDTNNKKHMSTCCSHHLGNIHFIFNNNNSLLEHSMYSTNKSHN